MNILITGGCGYTGTVLTNYLSKLGNNITVIDTQWFGNKINKSKNVNIIKDDIRNISKLKIPKIDSVIHLANIANDPSVDLNQTLSWEVNCLATLELIEKSIKLGAHQFIFASSGSVYGIKKEQKVTEDLDLVPISTYNKTKMVAEKILLNYKDKIKVHCIRPATVCGISPRMRFDVSVNMLTLQALKTNKIKVLGGKQIRPNIHINDLIRVYEFFLVNKKIDSGPYNAGFENFSIMKLAKIIAKKTDATIEVVKSNDPRSYRQDSSKLISLGFTKQYSVNNAIDEIILSFKNGNLIEDDSCYTVKWMKKKKIS